MFHSGFIGFRFFSFFLLTQVGCLVCKGLLYFVILSVRLLIVTYSGVQSSYSCRVAAGDCDQQGQCAAESRPSWSHAPRQMLSTVHGEGVQAGDAGQHVPGDPSVQPQRRRSAVEETGHR